MIGCWEVKQTQGTWFWSSHLISTSRNHVSLFQLNSLCQGKRLPSSIKSCCKTHFKRVTLLRPQTHQDLEKNVITDTRSNTKDYIGGHLFLGSVSSKLKDKKTSSLTDNLLLVK